MKRGVWTIATVVLLAQFAAKTGLAQLGFGPSLGTAAAVFSILFYVSLAAVAWMQTRWGALLVVVMGTLLVAYELAAAASNLFPQFGTQMQQLLLALLTLTIPVFAFLSYRSQSRGEAQGGVPSPV